MKLKSLITKVGFIALAFPLLVFADPGPLAPKCTSSGGVAGACGYNDLIKLGQNFLTWAIYIAVLAAVVGIIWAGFLYLSSAGDMGKVKKAHEVFWKVGMGIVITLSAWLIVKSVLTWLGVTGDWTLLN